MKTAIPNTIKNEKQAKHLGPQPNKYTPYPKINLKDRTWPEKTIQKAPHWCSVDLRDGNQALITPMSIAEKTEFFKMLVNIGFKEIEVGFPSASQIEFDFLRTLVEQNLIPDDVKIQVLVQAREHLIKRTFEALQGVKKPILHFYNSTSTAQRKIVFNKDKEAIKQLAIQGVKWVKKYSEEYKVPVQVEYSAESFTGTEIEYALDVCNAVINEWAPTTDNKIIINLPATVEMSTPNIYADQIEWMGRNLNQREKVIISTHTHNDRGTAVAAAELAMLAGADRLEGALFGNGERTGNMDIITVAMNMYTQGINPELDFSQILDIRNIAEKCNKIEVPVRHPYAGDLVFTAFSGSHQDAINKGLAYQKAKTNNPLWEVPYLPIDPSDVGRSYEDIIRINSQSGKGGVAFILEKQRSYQLPKIMHPEFATIIQTIADKTGKEVDAREISTIFDKEYVESNTPFKFISYKTRTLENLYCEGTIQLEISGKKIILTGTGNGPIDACKTALATYKEIPNFKLASYNEHSLETGSTAKAISYIQLEDDQKGIKRFGVGLDSNIIIASVKAMVSGLNRLIKAAS